MAAAGIPKTFWSNPFRYLKWAFHEKPAIAYSVLIGSMGPAFLLAAPTLRRWAGDETPAKIPLTYPGELAQARLRLRYETQLDESL